MLQLVSPDKPLNETLLSVILQGRIVRPVPGHTLVVTVKAVPDNTNEGKAP